MSDEDNIITPSDDFGIDYTKVGVLSAICIGTIIGNVAVILAIVARNIKMTRMYYFIIHLSIADLLTAFFTMLPEIIWTVTIDFYGGNVVCKITKFSQMIGPYLSSYVLIMTAIDRYQAICNPLSSCTWTPKRSNIMIGIAWTISLLLCIPQVVIFSSPEYGRCSAGFAKGPDWWSVQKSIKAYILWYSISNFLLPFVILVFCYGRICYVIWDNFNNKIISTTIDDKSGGKTSTVRERISRALTATKQKCNRRKKDIPFDQAEETNRDTKSNAADEFRVHDENALRKHPWTQQHECSDDDSSDDEKHETGNPVRSSKLEMKSLIQADKISTIRTNACVDGDQARSEINTTAIVEPPARIYVEPPSNTSNSDNKESEVLSKSYVEFRAGEVNYPQSDSGSQSSGSVHKELPAGNRKSSQLSYINGSDDCPGAKLNNDLDPMPSVSPSLEPNCHQKTFPLKCKKEQNDNKPQKSIIAANSAERDNRASSVSNQHLERINPRTHSIRGISKAKIKTVKLTIAVILGYILCSAPFILVQLWQQFGTLPEKLRESMYVLYYCLTLNSVVNPWIYMMFNCNLVESLRHLICPCIGCSGDSKPCLCLKRPRGLGARDKNHALQAGRKTTMTTTMSVTVNTGITVNRGGKGRNGSELANPMTGISSLPLLKTSKTNKQECLEEKRVGTRQLGVQQNPEMSPNVSQTSIAIISAATTTNVSNNGGASNRASVGSCMGISALPADGAACEKTC